MGFAVLPYLIPLPSFFFWSFCFLIRTRVFPSGYKGSGFGVGLTRCAPFPPLLQVPPLRSTPPGLCLPWELRPPPSPDHPSRTRCSLSFSPGFLWRFFRKAFSASVDLLRACGVPFINFLNLITFPPVYHRVSCAVDLPDSPFTLPFLFSPLVESASVPEDELPWRIILAEALTFRS